MWLGLGLVGLAGGTRAEGLAALLGALGTVSMLAIGRGVVCLLSRFIAELILVVQHGGWLGTLCLVVGLLCSGVPVGRVAMLGCGVFLVWVGEFQTKSRMSLYIFIRA